MPPVQTLKLLTNLAATGTVKYIDHYEEKENPNQPGKMMSAQWGFKGVFDLQDGQGPREGRIYCDAFQLSADPVQLGLAAPDGTDARTGAQRYKWVYAGPIQLVKREDGRKRVIQIARVGEAQPPLGSMPGSPRQTATGPEVDTQTTWQAPPPALRVAQARSEPAVSAAFVGGPAAHDEWAALEARYARCVDIATRVWSVNNYDSTSEAMVAAAATLFIEANKEHLQTAPAILQSPPPHTTATILAPSTEGQRVTFQAPATTPGASVPPRPEQIAQYRALAGNETFTPAERGTWLERLGQHLYSNDEPSLRNDLTRMGHLIATRTSKMPQPAVRHAAGPGIPGASYDVLPEDEGLEGLPF